MNDSAADRAGSRYGPRSSGAVPLGLALITVGVLLLLDRAEVLDAGQLFVAWWPLALVLPGLWWLATGARVLGLIAVVTGSLLLLDNLEIARVSLASLIFPVILVVVGAALARGGVALRAAVAGRGGTAASNGGDRPRIDVGATAVFGDARLSITDGDDDRVAIGTSAVFGDVEVEVPAGWRVADHTTTVLGDVTVPRDQPTYPEAPVVELHGLVLFGDLRVRYLDAPEVS